MNFHALIDNVSVTVGSKFMPKYFREGINSPSLRKAVDPKAKENPSTIKSVLNFEKDFANQDNSNVFPLLARYDQLVRYEIQKDSYGKIPVQTIEKGHATGALSYNLLREHVLKSLK